jgi:hypothetical protein
MIITLTTDFGLADPFVGIMKGVILGIAPNVQLVDVTHEIPPFDILEAAFLLDSAYPYFPPGTIHVVVVDPEVGSLRRPMVAAANGHIFVAPDNGVLSFVLNTESRAPAPAAYWVTNDKLFLDPVSQTFHGRDIFAPVAAHLARGTAIESVGPRISDFIQKSPSKPNVQDGKLVGKVLRIDKFGNIITNLRRQDLPAEFSIHVASSVIRRLCSNFSEADPGEYFAIEGSTGYIELALNQGSAAAALEVRRGAEIEVETGLVNQ